VITTTPKKIKKLNPLVKEAELAEP